MLAQLKSYGLDAKIETFDTLFPTPKSRKLELIRADGTKFVAKIDEPVVKGGPRRPIRRVSSCRRTTRTQAMADVTAPLVYVNYGAPDDYEKLAAMGVSVKGAIAIVRYGQTWRGIKPKLAAQHGAVGCLIFSDPAAGWVCAGRYVSGRADASAGWGAARQRDGYAGVPGRSADAGDWRGTGSEADSAEGCARRLRRFR